MFELCWDPKDEDPKDQEDPMDKEDPMDLKDDVMLGLEIGGGEWTTHAQQILDNPPPLVRALSHMLLESGSLVPESHTAQAVDKWSVSKS